MSMSMSMNLLPALKIYASTKKGRVLMTEQDRLGKAVKTVQQYCPSYSVNLKKDSKVQKAIGWILGKIGNPDYMTSFVTTLGQTTYLPSTCDDGPGDGMWQVILHEGQHAKDAQKIGNWVFGAAYLLPQLLGVLGIAYTLVVGIALLFGAPLALLWGCTSLLLLAPLPAFGRAYAEIRGYTVSLAVGFWSGTLGDEAAYLNGLVDIFSGPSYYYMWIFKKWTRSYFEQKLQELKTNTFVLDSYLAACKALSKELVG